LPRPQKSSSRIREIRSSSRLDEELKRRDQEAWWIGKAARNTWENVYGAIEAAHTFIFVLTPDSIASEGLRQESRAAAGIINASCRSSIAT
jgi:hypothetical protein